MQPKRKENYHRVSECSHRSIKRRKNGTNEVKDWNIRSVKREKLFYPHFPANSPSPLHNFPHYWYKSQCSVFQCLISSSNMHRHYLGLFRHAKPMLMAEHPVSDVLFSLYARRHLGKSQGRKMKVRGIANIHPRQLFMNIKEQLWMEAGSHHFLLIISKHWNTLQLNGFIPCKVCDYHLLAAIKFN